MGKLFGTDGIRGIANSELTPELACALGKACTYILKKSMNGKAPSFVIGKDTRISGDMLEDGIASGIMAAGGNVISVGVIPTPAVALLVRKYEADCGVVISASHNPFEYNGIKFFSNEGFKLNDEMEEAIEHIVLNNIDIGISEVIGTKKDKAQEAISIYSEYLIESAKKDLSGYKIVFDAANGASAEVSKNVFSKLGIETTFIGVEPDGVNINEGVGSTHPEKLSEEVVTRGADLGIALDGDADRIIVVDEKGKILDGDTILYICALDLKSKGQLKNNLVISTIMSNLGLKLSLEAQGVETMFSDVGDRHVLELMQKEGSVFGGEPSGHIIFLDGNTTGDGMYAALRLLEALSEKSGKLSEAATGIEILPSTLKNARIKNEFKKTYRDDKEINEAIENVEKQLAGQGRVLIRPSGTEPLIRIMLEGSDQEYLERAASELVAIIESKLS